MNREESPPLGEGDLVDRLEAGDRHALEELVRSHGGRLLAVARRYLDNEEDARDAVQEGFLRAFHAIDRFGGGSRLSTWLHRIVVNAALVKLRTRRRKPEVSIESLLPQFLDDGHRAFPGARWSETAEEALARKETRTLVREQIERLPETYRLVLLLREMEGFDTAETAELLGITPNAVKIRLHRARQVLRTLLEPHFSGTGT